ncbi:MAG: MFS transporter [Sphingomonadales bacterium]
MSPTNPGSPYNFKSQAAIISMISVVGLTLGLTLPLLAIILEQRGVPASVIGMNSAMPALALLITTPFVPRMLRAFGAFPFLVANLVIAGGTLLALKWFDNLAIWFVLRFILGTSLGGLFTVGEAWINAIAPEDKRGRVMGLYSALLSAGFGLGAAMFRFTGVEG